MYHGFMTYSLDLRKKALEYLEKGGTEEAAAAIFGVTTRTLSNWKRRKRDQNLAPKARCLGPSKIDSDRLRQYVKDHPDAYLREIAQEFGSTLQAIFYACKRLKISLKKRSVSIKKEMRRNGSNL